MRFFKGLWRFVYVQVLLACFTAALVCRITLSGVVCFFYKDVNEKLRKNLTTIKDMEW